jgi:hypothetical protein
VFIGEDLKEISDWKVVLEENINIIQNICDHLETKKTQIQTRPT